MRFLKNEATLKKYFIYELKKNMLAAIIITVLVTVIHLAVVINSVFIPYNHVYYGGEYTYINDSAIVLPFVLLMILCTLIPIMMFSFKMSARQVDLYYSVPLKRQKVYLVKSLIGLLLVLVPYTISYWLGFLATVLKPNLFELVWFVPAYFASLPFAVLLFGVNAFIFTRANTIVDGVMCVLLYSCALALGVFAILGFIAEYYSMHFEIYSVDSFYGSAFFTYSPLALLVTRYSALIVKHDLSDYYNVIFALSYVFGVVSGIASCLDFSLP